MSEYFSNLDLLYSTEIYETYLNKPHCPPVLFTYSTDKEAHKSLRLAANTKNYLFQICLRKG